MTPVIYANENIQVTGSTVTTGSGTILVSEVVRIDERVRHKIVEHDPAGDLSLWQRLTSLNEPRTEQIPVYEVHAVLSDGRQVKLVSSQDREVCSAVVSAVGQATGASGRGAAPELSTELAALADLKERGVIDDSELKRAKDLLLGMTPARRESAIDQLASLHSLYRQGVLSEMEFNMKKWAILSRAE